MNWEIYANTFSVEALLDRKLLTIYGDWHLPVTDQAHLKTVSLERLSILSRLSAVARFEIGSEDEVRKAVARNWGKRSRSLDQGFKFVGLCSFWRNQVQFHWFISNDKFESLTGKLDMAFSGVGPCHLKLSLCGMLTLGDGQIENTVRDIDAWFDDDDAIVVSDAMPSVEIFYGSRVPEKPTWEEVQRRQFWDL